MIQKNFISLLCLLTIISGCSLLPNKKVEIVSKPLQIDIMQPDLPRPVDLTAPKWFVVSEAQIANPCKKVFDEEKQKEVRPKACAKEDTENPDWPEDYTYLDRFLDEMKEMNNGEVLFVATTVGDYKVMAEDMKIIVSEGHHENVDKKPEDMTKVELKAAMGDMMKKMNGNGKKKDEMVKMVNAMYGAMKMGGHEEDDDDEDETNEQVERRIKEIDVSEHVDALMNNEGDLSEEFKRKAATVFEAAVKSKIRDEVERLEEEYKTELDESIEQTKSELSEKVDTYLNYVVEEWMKENELAIERGLKGEIAEDFISGLKTGFKLERPSRVVSGLLQSSLSTTTSTSFSAPVSLFLRIILVSIGMISSS